MLMLLLEAFVFVGGKRANFRCLLLVESNSKNTANTNIDFISIINQKRLGSKEVNLTKITFKRTIYLRESFIAEKNE